MEKLNLEVEDVSGINWLDEWKNISWCFPL